MIIKILKRLKKVYGLRQNRKILKFVNEKSIYMEWGKPRFEKVRKLLNKLPNVSLGENCIVEGPIIITANLIAGKDCFFGNGFRAISGGTIVIGDGVKFGPQVSITTGNHLIGKTEMRAGKGFACNLSIGDGCWFGIRTTIVVRNNYSIGNGVVVAAGSVVINEIENDLLVAGVPAVKKKKLPANNS